MKTATQKLFEYLETFDVCVNNDVKDEISELFRQQIIDAYIEGYSAPENRGDSEQYFNETFKP